MEVEHAVEGGQGLRQALVHTEEEVKKLQGHVSELNQMLQKCDSEIDRHRLALDHTR